MPERTRRPGLCARASLAAAALTLTLLSAHALRAQSSSPSSSSQSARDARWQEMQMRQRALRELDKLKEPRKSRDTRPAYRDVAQDFEQLQLVNYSLAAAAAPESPLDYESIRKQAADVRKHAAKLKEYLSLPKVEEDAAKAGEAAAAKEPEMQTAEGLRSAVASLDALVNSFAWNPIFRQPDVVDLEQSTKASRDLAGIISLSERIRRRAEELGKAAKKVAGK